MWRANRTAGGHLDHISYGACGFDAQASAQILDGHGSREQVSLCSGVPKAQQGGRLGFSLDALGDDA